MHWRWRLCSRRCATLVFPSFKIDIPVGTEKTAFHLGNVFCVLAALFLGGLWGGMAGAVGMTIADLTSGYVTSAPQDLPAEAVHRPHRGSGGPLCVPPGPGTAAPETSFGNGSLHSLRHGLQRGGRSRGWVFL